ncbi:uncharacterized protein L201_003007 [Kwoniella dendrophila CBS 6074]|uniref:Zn(2)-C6 fungal-type domain-containing protein n=1 Tax=Kwoniella dendrophila CBS 6074 TaxID=1295534 RepID=A0AAX4JTI1_9TREE
MVGYTPDIQYKHSGSTDAETSTTAPLKRRRITRACDRCNKNGTKCAPGPTPSQCAACASFGSNCTYDRPVKRRGPNAKSNEHSCHDHRNGAKPGSETPTTDSPMSDDIWRYHEIASHAIIEELVEAYYHIVYPISPFFHWPTFTKAIQNRLYTKSRAFHCLVMTVCAIASARLRDGAQQYWQAGSSNIDHSDFDILHDSESFYHSALSSFPSDVTQATDFDYKRAKCLLSVLCIQYGQIDKATLHLGDLCTLCSLSGFHTESRWPKGLNEIELQERRRLYWCAYQLSVYLSTSFGGTLMFREAQTTVLYPAEVLSEEQITPEAILPPPARYAPGKVSFFKGNNFVSSLYRILEHAVCQMRQRHQHYDCGDQIAMLFSVRKFGRANEPTPEEVLATVENLFNDLPWCLQGAREWSGDPEQDVYGFQATNIVITLQTVKMVMAGMAEWSVEQRCVIAGELLDSLAALPKHFLAACSSPALHHMAGVGHLLASIIQSPLSPSCYLHVRTVLLRMADLLSSLESTIKSASTLCIAAKLRDHVERIDEYMMNATEAARWNFALNSSVPAEGGDTSIRTPTIYPPLEPLIAGNVRITKPESSAQRSTQIGNSNHELSNINIYPPVSTNGIYPDNNTQAMPPSENTSGEVQTDQQFQLPNDLFSDWSYMFNELGSQGDAFEFLSSSIPGILPSGNDWAAPSDT